MSELPAEVLARRDFRLPLKPAPAVLTGTLVELRPLELAADADALHAVSSGAPFTLAGRSVGSYDPDDRIWRWMSGGPFADAAALRGWLAALAAEARRPGAHRAGRRHAGRGRVLPRQPAAAPQDRARRDLVRADRAGHRGVGPRPRTCSPGTRSRSATAASSGSATPRNQRSRRAAVAYGFAFEACRTRTTSSRAGTATPRGTACSTPSGRRSATGSPATRPRGAGRPRDRARAQALPRTRSIQPAEHALAVGAQPVVLELAGDPRAQAADRRRGVLGEPPLDVEVVDVDRRRDRDVVAAELVGVVQPRARRGRRAARRRRRAAAARRSPPTSTEHLLGGEVALGGRSRRAAAAPPTTGSRRRRRTTTRCSVA